MLPGYLQHLLGRRLVASHSRSFSTKCADKLEETNGQFCCPTTEVAKRYRQHRCHCEDDCHLLHKPHPIHLACRQCLDCLDLQHGGAIRWKRLAAPGVHHRDLETIQDELFDSADCSFLPHPTEAMSARAGLPGPKRSTRLSRHVVWSTYVPDSADIGLKVFAGSELFRSCVEQDIWSSHEGD